MMDPEDNSLNINAQPFQPSFNSAPGEGAPEGAPAQDPAEQRRYYQQQRQQQGNGTTKQQAKEQGHRSIVVCIPQEGIVSQTPEQGRTHVQELLGNECGPIEEARWFLFKPQDHADSVPLAPQLEGYLTFREMEGPQRAMRLNSHAESGLVQLQVLIDDPNTEGSRFRFTLQRAPFTGEVVVRKLPTDVDHNMFLTWLHRHNVTPKKVAHRIGRDQTGVASLRFGSILEAARTWRLLRGTSYGEHELLVIPGIRREEAQALAEAQRGGLDPPCATIREALEKRFGDEQLRRQGTVNRGEVMFKLHGQPVQVRSFVEAECRRLRLSIKEQENDPQVVIVAPIDDHLPQVQANQLPADYYPAPGRPGQGVNPPRPGENGQMLARKAPPGMSAPPGMGGQPRGPPGLDGPPGMDRREDARGTRAPGSAGRDRLTGRGFGMQSPPGERPAFLQKRAEHKEAKLRKPRSQSGAGSDLWMAVGPTNGTVDNEPFQSDRGFARMKEGVVRRVQHGFPLGYTLRSAATDRIHSEMGHHQ